MKNKAMQQQLESALSLCKEIVGKMEPIEYQDAVIVSQIQCAVYDAYVKQLEQEEQKLIQELHQVVLEYSGKITATRELIHHAIRKSGLNEGMRMAVLD